MAMHIRESAVDSVMTKRQTGMVDAEEMKDRAVQVVALRFFLRRLITELVADAEGAPRSPAPASQVTNVPPL